MMRASRLLAATAIGTAMALAVATWVVDWSDLWSTPDQRGRRLIGERRYAEAAASFVDPMWLGVAEFKAGNFKEAAQTFGGVDTPEAAFDQGNALVMLGKYDEAIARYDRALTLRPGWPDAEANRTLSRLRAELVRKKGGDAGDQREGADQIVYDKDRKTQDGQETKVASAGMSEEAVRALWLKRVQTKPADFLRSRFQYQLQANAP